MTETGALPPPHSFSSFVAQNRGSAPLLFFHCLCAKTLCFFISFV
uniref:Uncharacterized protein n=1 Tax=Nelumbo nucifera TaxID=4432 RepID=A0A822ZYU0_NELNU|nr:TPA_asm: hypothetical protein HUJ06_017055 [Nelumbo nucifera]